MNRLSGVPVCVIRGFPSSWTTHRRTIQVPSSQPLTSDHRPFTRNLPGTTWACPEVRVRFAVMTSGLAWIVCAASGESWAAVQCVFPFHTHHATEASARANSSKISSASIGVRSSPPYALGRKIRKIRHGPILARCPPVTAAMPRCGRVLPIFEADTTERLPGAHYRFLFRAWTPSVEFQSRSQTARKDFSLLYPLRP